MEPKDGNKILLRNVGRISADCKALLRSRDSSVRYGLDGRGFGVRVPVELRVYLFHVVRTGSGAQPASCPKGTGVKAVGAVYVYIRSPTRLFDAVLN
jgi:hypothetical protein